MSDHLSKEYEATVLTSGGQIHESHVSEDWAVLKLKKYKQKELQSLPIATSECNLNDLVFDQVITLGFPSTFNNDIPLFKASIGRLERIIPYDEMNKSYLFEVTSGIIEHGNSGGPLYDLNKQLIIGINTFAIDIPQLLHIQNFAIPINKIYKNITTNLIDIFYEKKLSSKRIEKKIRTYINSGRNEDAYRASLSLANTNKIKKMALINIYLQHKNYNKSFSLLKELIKISNDFKAHELYIKYLIFSDKIDTALVYLDKKLKKPNAIFYYYRCLAKLYKINSLFESFDEFIYRNYLKTVVDQQFKKRYFKEGEKKVEGLRDAIIFLRSCVKDAYDALYYAEKKGYHTFYPVNLKKNLGLLIAIGYEPKNSFSIDLDYAKIILSEYLEQNNYSIDYEAQAALHMLDFFLGKNESILNILKLRNIMNNQGTLFHPRSLFVHCCIQVICFNQYRLTNRTSYLNHGIQASIDGMRCSYDVNDIYNKIYIHIIKHFFNHFLNFVKKDELQNEVLKNVSDFLPINSIQKRFKFN